MKTKQRNIAMLKARKKTLRSSFMPLPLNLSEKSPGNEDLNNWPKILYALGNIIFMNKKKLFTVRRALPWPPNKLFLQVSQSGYANLINGHASLQSDATTNYLKHAVFTNRFVFHEQGRR